MVLAVGRGSPWVGGVGLVVQNQEGQVAVVAGVGRVQDTLGRRGAGGGRAM
jgi:hypothetical protein